MNHFRHGTTRYLQIATLSGVVLRKLPSRLVCISNFNTALYTKIKLPNELGKVHCSSGALKEII
jgi:hypothetical protein